MTFSFELLNLADECLNINQEVIDSENSVKLLGVEIDNKLSFENLSTLVKKASNQPNAFSRIQKFMGFKEKEILLNSFVYSNFNYCPLVWHFCSTKSVKKIEYFITTFPVITSLS